MKYDYAHSYSTARLLDRCAMLIAFISIAPSITASVTCFRYGNTKFLDMDAPSWLVGLIILVVGILTGSLFYSLLHGFALLLERVTEIAENTATRPTKGASQKASARASKDAQTKEEPKAFTLEDLLSEGVITKEDYEQYK